MSCNEAFYPWMHLLVVLTTILSRCCIKKECIGQLPTVQILSYNSFLLGLRHNITSGSYYQELNIISKLTQKDKAVRFFTMFKANLLTSDCLLGSNTPSLRNQILVSAIRCFLMIQFVNLTCIVSCHATAGKRYKQCKHIYILGLTRCLHS